MTDWTAIKEIFEVNFENRTRFEIATEWFYELQDPNIAVEKIQEWQKWLAESPENIREYERVEEVLNLSGDMEGLVWPDDRDLLADDYDGEEKIESWKKPAKKRAFNPFSVFSLEKLYDWRPFQVSTLSVVYAALFCIAIVNLSDFSGNYPVDVAVYESATGQNREVLLEDGSVITLGGQSLVSVAYSKSRRQIVLERGEAYFDVAKDADRPFSVVTGNRVVTAVGTQFNISKQAERVVVIVAEGKISIAPEQYETKTGNTIDAYLTAGQRVYYDKEYLSDIAVSPVNASLAWKDGKLQYMEEKLMYVVEDINRYSKIKIRFAGEEAKEFLYSGTVFTGNLEQWVEVLPHAFPLSVSYVGDSEIVLSVHAGAI
ncbi:FecR domain-containing protein [Alteromonas sp. 1_MG-2023]|uniref:FecR family protein n=1 Tax=Alteromonas sp. 1_MG-2023 TaxID=3062669 RepID=UPI0026E19EE8|nr:FecR domain-containing protein [Alteromonas sp. 1_MG-2023]MDO6476142.1 FecR domain-containing protein [Alteromonas sp. 1_MG-2023]